MNRIIKSLATVSLAALCGMSFFTAGAQDAEASYRQVRVNAIRKASNEASATAQVKSDLVAKARAKCRRGTIQEVEVRTYPTQLRGAVRVRGTGVYNCHL